MSIINTQLIINTYHTSHVPLVIDLFASKQLLLFQKHRHHNSLDSVAISMILNDINMTIVIFNFSYSDFTYYLCHMNNIP